MWESRNKIFYDDGRVFNSEWCSKNLVVPHSQGVVCLVSQYMIAVMKEYNVKRHYSTEHSSSLMTFLVWHEWTKTEHKKKSSKKQQGVLPVARKIQNLLQN